MTDQPTPDQLRKAFEESEEGETPKVGDPRGRPEPGPIVVGPVDAGPTGEHEGGYREATPASRIIYVGAAVIIAIVALLAFVFYLR